MLLLTYHAQNRRDLLMLLYMDVDRCRSGWMLLTWLEAYPKRGVHKPGRSLLFVIG